MAEYTPTTEQVRAAFIAQEDFYARVASLEPPTSEESGEDFDRWLAEVRREAAEKAADALRAEVERLREGAGRALVDRDAYWAELDEARQQLADLRAGIEALLPGETVNVYAGGGNLVSQRRVVDPDHLRTLLAGSGEQPGVRARCSECGPGYRVGDEGCRHRSAPVVPDVVRELDAVMHHHADRADAAEAEVERLRGVERGWQHDRSEWEKERDEARRQVADLRAGIESVQKAIENNRGIDRAWDALNALLAGSGEQLSEHPCGDYPAPCNCDDPETHDRPAPVVPDSADVRHLADRIETAMTDDGHRMPRTDETRYLAHVAAQTALAVVRSSGQEGS